MAGAPEQEQEGQPMGWIERVAADLGGRFGALRFEVAGEGGAGEGAETLRCVFGWPQAAEDIPEVADAVRSSLVDALARRIRQIGAAEIRRRVIIADEGTRPISRADYEARVGEPCPEDASPMEIILSLRVRPKVRVMACFDCETAPNGDGEAKDEAQVVDLGDKPDAGDWLDEIAGGFSD